MARLCKMKCEAKSVLHFRGHRVQIVLGAGNPIDQFHVVIISFCISKYLAL